MEEFEMRQSSSRTAALVLGLLALLAGAPRARAADADREALLRAFRHLRDNFEAVAPPLKAVKRHPAYAPKGKLGAPVTQELPSDKVRDALPKVKVVKPNVGGTGHEVKGMVKVWAELKDGGKKVHLARYNWKPKERFYLCFETALPVKVGLYQTYENKDKPVRILPDEEVPESLGAVQPGKAYRFPALLEMDDNDDDETLSLVIVGVGTKEEPRLGGDKKKYSVHAARKYAEGVDALFASARNRKLEWQTSARRLNLEAGADPGSRVTSSNADDVAIIAFGPDLRGYISLKLKKAR
jgi:hypothetical protein